MRFLATSCACLAFVQMFSIWLILLSAVMDEVSGVSIWVFVGCPNISSNRVCDRPSWSLELWKYSAIDSLSAHVSGLSVQ